MARLESQSESEPEPEPELQFSVELRTKTQRHHTASDALAAPVALSSPRVYRLLLSSFYHIYAALEQEMHIRRHLHPKVGCLYFRQLLRTPAFERDLAHYGAADECITIPPPSPAAQAYVDELRSVVARDPILLIAYSQTMYMALFGGGPAIKRWVTLAFGATEQGTAVFDFSDTIKHPKQFRRLYNEALDSIALTRGEKDRIIERKKRIFELNDSIFAELRATAAYRKRVASVLLRIVIVVMVIIFGARLFRAHVTPFFAGLLHS